MKNDINWKRPNRFGSMILIFASLLYISIAFIVPHPFIDYVIIGSLVLLTLIIYSASWHFYDTTKQDALS